ncbi:MAG: response regulator [Gemmatimonadaceae bacterium]
MDPLHILLVDDHDFTRSLHKRVLTELGATTIAEARDGVEALASARVQRPDIVITDLNMPGMDGMTFIGHLAQEHLADSVIIASGLAPGVLRAVEAMAVASGIRVLGALEKPLRKDALDGMLFVHRNPPVPGASPATSTLDSLTVERAAELGQFRAWYAPVLDVAFMRTVATEVVPRWESPDRGVVSGDAALGDIFDMPAAPAVMRSIVTAALNAGGLWQQMGWNGVVTMPAGLAAIRDGGFWDWMSDTVRTHGANGTLAVTVDGALFARDPARGAFAVARAMMDGYFLVVRVQEPDEVRALNALAACSVITCPVRWLAEAPAAMERVYEFASRMSAEIGVHGVEDAAMLGRLARASVRRAQGPAVGRPASAAETYDTHLAHR